MKKAALLFFALLFFLKLPVTAQTSSEDLLSPNQNNQRTTYKQLDVSIPAAYDFTNVNNNNGVSSVLPAGINAIVGYGLNYHNRLGIGLHSGLNTRWDEKLVAVPVFGNFRFSPMIGKNHFISMQVGYGKAFGLGRGDLSGDYKRINVGLGNTSEIIRGAIFVEYNEMDFPIGDRKKIAAVALGVSFYFF